MLKLSKASSLFIVCIADRITWVLLRYWRSRLQAGSAIPWCGHVSAYRILVCELHIEKERVSIKRYQVRDYGVERTRYFGVARQNLPIELAAGHVVRLHQIT